MVQAVYAVLDGAAVPLCHQLLSAEWDLLARDQVAQRSSKQLTEQRFHKRGASSLLLSRCITVLRPLHLLQA